MKKLAYILFLTLCLACGGGGGGGGNDSGVDLSNDACGSLGLKIFDGTSCSSTASSPVVLLRINTFDGQTALCTGTVISSRHILTAGHCIPGQGANTKSIFVDVGGQSLRASAFVVAPGYEERDDLSAIFNDAGIIELPQDVSVPPVPLLLSRDVQKNDVLAIFGYGLTESGGLGDLRSGQMLVTDVTPTHIVSDFDGDGSNTCIGDSGGPGLEASPSGSVGIVGITSTGKPDTLCRPGDVSLFTNVQNPGIVNFITSVVGNVGVI